MFQWRQVWSYGNQFLTHLLMHILGHIFRVVTWIHWVFWVLQQIFCDPTEVDQTSTCVPMAFCWHHCSPLFSHSHLDALSAASALLFMALFLLALMLSSVVPAQGMTCKPPISHLHCSVPLPSLGTSPSFLNEPPPLSPPRAQWAPEVWAV